MTAAQHVRERLADSRRAGESFETAWTRAVADLPSSSPNRRDELTGVLAAEDAFRRAYVGATPVGAERVLANIIELRDWQAVDQLPPAA